MGLFCELRSCCCFCSLRNGTLIIGIFELILGIAGIVLSVFVITHTAENKVNNKIKLAGGNEINASDLTNVYIAVCVFSVVLALINLLLIWGVGQRKTSLFLPWLIVTILVTLATLIVGILLAIPEFEASNIITAVLYVLFALLAFLFRWYFISVVYSYFDQIQRTEAT